MGEKQTSLPNMERLGETKWAGGIERHFPFCWLELKQLSPYSAEMILDLGSIYPRSFASWKQSSDPQEERSKA